MSSDICHECGGRMVLSSELGRLRSYRGKPGYVVPPDIVYPRCRDCGAEWLTADQILLLSNALEQQRTLRWQERRRMW